MFLLLCRDSEQQVKEAIPEREDSRVSGGACDDDDDVDGILLS